MLQHAVEVLPVTEALVRARGQFQTLGDQTGADITFERASAGLVTER